MSRNGKGRRRLSAAVSMPNVLSRSTSEAMPRKPTLAGTSSMIQAVHQCAAGPPAVRSHLQRDLTCRGEVHAPRDHVD